MTSTSTEQWAMALWKHYLPGIENGAPFYLAADGRLIGELYVRALQGQGGKDVALREFHGACVALLNTRGNRTEVLRQAFQRLTKEPYSRVICLAVQQVLVVERMLHDQQYSERSYFPRYRELLGIASAQSCPMRTDGFREIWAVLARELSEVIGASTRTVTFSAGKGPDLNRHFPFSQALFTTHDLTVIREGAPSIDATGDGSDVLGALWHVRRQLAARARTLIDMATVDEVVAGRVCAQVQSFLASDAQLSALRGKSDVVADVGQVVAYLDRIDAFDDNAAVDSFSVYSRGTEQTTGESLEAALSRKLSAGPVVLLVSNGDAFREISRQDLVVPGDAVIAIIEAAKSDAFQAGAIRVCGVTFVRGNSNLSERFELLVCSGVVDGRLNKLLGLQEGAASARGIELEGGLLADLRSRIFVAGYPPTAVRHCGVILSIRDEITVGGVVRPVGEFLTHLARKGGDGRYTIEHGTNSLTFSIARKRVTLEVRAEIGYAMIEGELDLVPRPWDEGQARLRGTWLSGGREQPASRLSALDVILLVGGRTRLAVSQDCALLVLRELQLLGDGNRLGDLAARQIALTRSVPLEAATSGLLRRLQAAGGRVLVMAGAQGQEASGSRRAGGDIGHRPPAGGGR